MFYYQHYKPFQELYSNFFQNYFVFTFYFGKKRKTTKCMHPQIETCAASNLKKNRHCLPVVY